jgi:serine/threonine-protein kinase PRP4
LCHRPNNPSHAPTVEAPEPESLDEVALIEQRRKRREAIKAKYRGSATPLLVQALQLGDKSGQSTPGQSQAGGEETPSRRSSKFSGPSSEEFTNANSPASPFMSTPTTPIDAQDPASPSAFAITNDQDLANANEALGSEEDGPSAADYDPTADMQEDNQRDSKRIVEEVSSGAYDETKATIEQDILFPVESTPLEERLKKSKDEFDMFADDDDDMFAEIPAPTTKPSAPANDDVAKTVPIPQAKVLDIGMLDNWDDAEGYYKIILGEKLDNRYHVQANLGKGMFSGVVRATDMTTNTLVAIKLIRNNETM